jgi:hypothetical protein
MTMHIYLHISTWRTRTTPVDPRFLLSLRTLFADVNDVKYMHEYGASVVVLQHSDKAHKLFALLNAFDITPVDIHNLCERESGLIALVHHVLVFPPTSNDLYYLAHHIGGLTNTFEDIPWHVRDGTCYVSEHSLRLFHDIMRHGHVFPQHAADCFRDLPMLMTTQMKERLEAQNLVGFAAVPVQPITHRNMKGTGERADFEIIMYGRPRAQFSDIKPVAPTSETNYWWALTPTVVMPALHPLFLRYDARLPKDKRVQISDPYYKGTLCFGSPTDLNIPPIYTPEAMSSMPPFDIARMNEHQTLGEYNGRLIVSERAKALLSEFLVDPDWQRVGVLPVDGRLPEISSE